MPRQKSARYPRKLLELSEKVVKAWKDLNFAVPNLKPADVDKFIADSRDKGKTVDKLSVERTKAIEVRDAAMNDLWDNIRKVRNAAQAQYGDDSQEVRKLGLQPVRGRKRKKKADRG